jgi:hypothetical protein
MMNHPEISRAIIRQRQEDLISQARANAQAREAREGRLPPSPRRFSWCLLALRYAPWLAR